MSSGVRTPDTTSSPWAFTRKSPEGSGAPVISSRENATPEHELSPLLPNTICCTLTAVPHSSGMRLMRRYSDRALAHPRVEHGPDRLAQLLARVLGEVLAGLVAVELLEVVHERPCRSSTVELGVELHAALRLRS